MPLKATGTSEEKINKVEGAIDLLSNTYHSLLLPDLGTYIEYIQALLNENLDNKNKLSSAVQESKNSAFVKIKDFQVNATVKAQADEMVEALIARLGSTILPSELTSSLSAIRDLRAKSGMLLSKENEARLNCLAGVQNIFETYRNVKSPADLKKYEFAQVSHRDLKGEGCSEEIVGKINSNRNFTSLQKAASDRVYKKAPAQQKPAAIPQVPPAPQPGQQPSPQPQKVDLDSFIASAKKITSKGAWESYLNNNMETLNGFGIDDFRQALRVISDVNEKLDMKYEDKASSLALQSLREITDRQRDKKKQQKPAVVPPPPPALQPEQRPAAPKLYPTIEKGEVVPQPSPQPSQIRKLANILANTDKINNKKDLEDYINNNKTTLLGFDHPDLVQAINGIWKRTGELGLRKDLGRVPGLAIYKGAP